MGQAPDKKPRSRRTKPFQPSVGTAFEGESVPTIEAKTRGFLARVVAALAGLSVVVTGGYWLFTGNYTPLVVVWGIVGPLIGGMMTYYFGRMGITHHEYPDRPVRRNG